MSLTIKNLPMLGGGSGIKPEDFGCTEMAVDTITLTSDMDWRDIPHSLGKVPKVVIFTSENVVGRVYYDYIVEGALFHFGTDGYVSGGINILQYTLKCCISAVCNTYLDTIKFYSGTRHVMAHTGGESDTTIYNARLRAGATYTFYTMA